MSKMNKSILFLIFLPLLLIQPINAENVDDSGGPRSHFYTKWIGINQGLTHPSVQAVHTDSDGVVWIGTRFLLNKYENGELSSYSASQTFGSYIYTLLEDSGQRMWVGTESSLVRYVKENDDFELILNRGIYSAIEYKDICYFSGSGDITAINRIDGTRTDYPAHTSMIINSFVVGENLIMFVDKFQGLLLLDVKTGEISRVSAPEIAGLPLISACFDDPYLYVSVFCKGLYKLDLEGFVVDRYLAADYPNLFLENIWSIKKVGSNILIATDGGGICALTGEGRIKPLNQLPQFEELTFLPPSTMYLSEDRFSNIWVGSVRDGLFGIKPTQIESLNDYTRIRSKDGFSCQIQDLCVSGGILWLATDLGLYKYSIENKSFEIVSTCSNEDVYSIVPLNKDSMMISSYTKGLFALNRRTGEKKNILIVDEKTNQKELMSIYLNRVFRVNDDDILVTGLGNYRYNASTGVMTPIRSNVGVARGLRCFSLSRDKKNVYAYSDNMFFEIDLVENVVSKSFKPIDHGKIQTAVFGGGMIYYGTDNGVYRFDLETRVVEAVYPDFFKRVTHICFRRGFNVLWIASFDTLFSFDLESKALEVYDEAEGYLLKEVLACEYVDGDFYFGGNDHLSIVPMDIIGNVRNNPLISVAGVTVDGKSVKKNSKGYYAIPNRNKVVEIHYSSTEGDPFRKTIMRYSIVGPESQDIETYSMSCLLKKLHYGKYKISSSFLGNNGVWSQPVDTVLLKVSPPLIRRLWFDAILAMLLLSLAALIWKRNEYKSEQEILSALDKSKKVEQESRSRFINSIEAELAVPLAQIGKMAKALLEDENPTMEDNRMNLQRIFDKTEYMEKILNTTIVQERPDSVENPFLNKFNQIIDNRISDQDLDVPYMVREMAMSRTALYDKIKELTGMGINEYIQGRRLMRARKLLIDTDMSITEVSEELGFSSPRYFSELFKKAYEVSPREFKKTITHRNENIIQNN